MDTKVSFFKHIAILFMGSGINVIIGLISTPIITRLVDPGAYGRLSFFNMYSNLVYVFLLAGYDQALTRYYYEAKEKNKQSSLVYNLLKLPIIIAFMCSIIIYVLKDKIEFVENNKFVAMLLCFNIMTLILFRFVTLILRLEMDTKSYSMLNILHKVFYIVFVVVLSKSIEGYSYEILVFSTVVAVLIPTIVGISIKKSIWNFCGVNIKRYENFKQVTMYSLPYVFSSVLSWGFEAIDKLSIKRLGTYADVGVYTSANNIVGIISVIATTFNTIWVPMAMENYTKYPENKSLYVKANRGITVVMYFIGISIILFKDLIVYLLGSSYRGASEIIPCLMFYPIMFAISETTVNGINFKEKSKYHIVITLTSMCVNLVGNTILVPMFGCVGAAMSTGFSYIVFWAVRTIVSTKLYYVDYGIKKFALITAVVYVYAIVNSFYDNYILSGALYICILAILVIAYKDIILEGIGYTRAFLHRGR